MLAKRKSAHFKAILIATTCKFVYLRLKVFKTNNRPTVPTGCVCLPTLLLPLLAISSSGWYCKRNIMRFQFRWCVSVVIKVVFWVEFRGVNWKLWKGRPLEVRIPTRVLRWTQWTLSSESRFWLQGGGPSGLQLRIYDFQWQLECMKVAQWL